MAAELACSYNVEAVDVGNSEQQNITNIKKLIL